MYVSAMLTLLLSLNQVHAKTLQRDGRASKCGDAPICLHVKPALPFYVEYTVFTFKTLQVIFTVTE